MNTAGSNLLRGLAAGALLLLARAGSAQPAPVPAALVADLVTTPAVEGSWPRPVAQVGGLAFFEADDGIHGRELWRTDGTTAGTALVADLCPGACSFNGTFVAVGDHVFGFGNDGTGKALFVIEASGATRLVRRFPGSLSGFQGAALAFVNRLWFVLLEGEGPVYCYRLWQSDGTFAGTAPLAFDLASGCSSQVIDLLGVAGGALYFSAFTDDAGREPWRTDGSAAGTLRVADLCPGTCFGVLELGFGSALSAGGNLYFVGDDGSSGTQVWMLGASAPAPRRLSDFAARQGQQPIVAIPFAFQGAAWVRAGYFPNSLGWYRATPDGLFPATEVQPQGPARTPFAVWPLGDRLFFQIFDGTTTNLWSAMPPLRPPELVLPGISYAEPVGSVGQRALLRVVPTINPGRLWVSDGTAAGTSQLGDFDAQSFGVTPSLQLPGGILLALTAPDHGYEPEPWVSDGTLAGTRRLADLRRRASSQPYMLAAAGDDLFFATGPAGDLYRARGLAATAAGLQAFWPDGIAAAGDTLIVNGYSGFTAVEPATGATRALSLPLGVSPSHLVRWGNRVAFAGFAGQQLWVTDGTQDGTRQVVDVNPAWANGCQTPCPAGWQVYPLNLTPIGDRLFFVGVPPGTDSAQLYVTDGSAEGTHPLLPPVLAAGHFRWIGDIMPFRGGVAVVVNVQSSAGSQAEIWTAEGTAATLALSLPAEPRLLGSLGGRLFFVALQEGYSVLKGTDGTSAGTATLSDLGGGAARPRLVAAKVVRDRLFFTVVDDLSGEELWVSDGTVQGTRRAADLLPGPKGSHPVELAAYRGCLLFAASDGISGHELWASNGATAWLASDIAAGPASSSPAAMTAAGGQIYLAADDGPHGRELFAIPAASLDARCAVQPPVAPEPPGGPWLTSAEVPGFRFKVLLGTGAAAVAGSQADCVAGTLCVAGARAGRAEVLARVVGPKPNGRLWPALIALTPSEVQVWIEQVATGERRYYRLPAAGGNTLAGMVDRAGFPAAAAATGSISAGTSVSAEADGWLTTPELPGFRFRVQLFLGDGRPQPVRMEPCLAEALCVSGAVPGRPEVFARVTGKRPNGRRWVAIGRLTTARVEVDVEQVASGEVRHYSLPPLAPASDRLEGLLDRNGFRP